MRHAAVRNAATAALAAEIRTGCCDGSIPEAVLHNPCATAQAVQRCAAGIYVRGQMTDRAEPHTSHMRRRKVVYRNRHDPDATLLQMAIE